MVADRPGFQYVNLHKAEPSELNAGFKTYGDNILWLLRNLEAAQSEIVEIRKKMAAPVVQQQAASGKNSGVYLPQALAGVNVDEAVATLAQWGRIDDKMILVSGVVIVTPSSPGPCNTDLTLPVASRFTDLVQLAGTANEENGVDTGTVVANVLTGNANIEWTATSTSAYNLVYLYFYQGYLV